MQASSKSATRWATPSFLWTPPPLNDELCQSLPPTRPVENTRSSQALTRLNGIHISVSFFLVQMHNSVLHIDNYFLTLDIINKTQLIASLSKNLPTKQEFNLQYHELLPCEALLKRGLECSLLMGQGCIYYIHPWNNLLGTFVKQ